MFGPATTWSALCQLRTGSRAVVEGALPSAGMTAEDEDCADPGKQSGREDSDAIRPDLPGTDAPAQYGFTLACGTRSPDDLSSSLMLGLSVGLSILTGIRGALENIDLWGQRGSSMSSVASPFCGPRRGAVAPLRSQEAI